MPKVIKTAWFKMYAHYKDAIQAADEREVGTAIKTAMAYFDGEKIAPESLPPIAYIIFSMIKPSIDQALTEYEQSREYGRTGAEKRWKNRAKKQ